MHCRSSYRGFSDELSKRAGKMSTDANDARQGGAVVSDGGPRTASQCCVALCGCTGMLVFGLMMQFRTSEDDMVPPPQPDLAGLSASPLSLETHGDESTLLWSTLSTFAMGVCLSVLVLPSFRSSSVMDSQVRRATGGVELGDGTNCAEKEPRVLALRVILLQWHRRACTRAFCRWHLAISRAQLNEQQGMCAAHIAVLHQQRVRLLHAAGMRARKEVAAALRRIERLHIRLRTAACEAAWRRWLRASAGGGGGGAPPVVQGMSTAMAIAPAACLRAVLLHRWRTTQRVAMAQWKAAARLQSAATKLTRSVARAVSKAEARGKREGAAAAAAKNVDMGEGKGNGSNVDRNAATYTVVDRDSARMQAATMLRTLLRSSAQLLMIRAMVQWSRFGCAPPSQRVPIAARSAAAAETTRNQLERALRSVFRVQKAPLRRVFLQWKLAARVLTTMNYSQRMMQKGRLKLEAAQRAQERSRRAQRIRFLVARCHAYVLRRAFTTLRLQSSEAALSAALSRQSGFMETTREQQQQQQQQQQQHLVRSTYEAQAALERKEQQVTSLLEQLDTRETRLSQDMAAFEERLSLIAQQHLDASLAHDRQGHPVGPALSAGDMPTPIASSGSSPYRRLSSSVTTAPFSPAPEHNGSQSVTLSATALQALDDSHADEPILYQAFWTWRIDTFSRNGTGLYACIERALLRCALDTTGGHTGLQSHEARGRETLRGVAGATLSVRGLEVRGCEQLERPLVQFSCGSQMGSSPSDDSNMQTCFAITDISQTLTVHVKEWNSPQVVVGELNVRLKVMDYNRTTRRWLPVLDPASRQKVGEVQLEMLLGADTTAARDIGGNSSTNDGSQAPGNTSAVSSARQPLGKVRSVADDRGSKRRDDALENVKDDSQENRGMGGMMPVRVHLDVKKSDYRTLLLDPRKHETWTAHNIGQLMRNKLLAAKPSENFDKWSLYASDDGVEIDRPIAPHETLHDLMQRTGLRLFGPNAMGKIVYQRCSRRDDANVRMTSHRKRKQRLQEMGRPRFAQRSVAAQAVHRPGAVSGSFR